jgi:hypothetical protein
MNSKTKTLIVCLVMAMAGGILFFGQSDQERNGGWAHSVLRNWGECGFFKLQGRMITNPGGYGVTEDPQYYTGHRPHVLRAAYFVGCLTGKPGYEGWLFQALLSALVGWAIWKGLGQSLASFLLAFCTIVSPGFIRHSLILDTLAIPVLLGIPFLVLASLMLRKEQVRSIDWICLLLLCVIYTALNWTTGMALVVAFAYFVTSPNFNLGKIVALFAAAGISAGIVLAISVLDKRSGDASAAHALVALYNNYLFGPGGYGIIPMDWMTATRRILVANVMALAPLLCAAGFVVSAKSWRSTFSIIALSPLLASFICVAFFRNYFATHPWMAAPVFIMGCIATLLSWHDRSKTKSELSAATTKVLVVLISLLSLAYSLILSQVYQLYSSGTAEIKSMVRSNTNREDIVFCDEVVLKDGMVLDWLESGCDRKFLLWSGKFDSTVLGSSKRKFLLTSNLDNAAGVLVADSDVPVGPVAGFLNIPLQWYRTKVARRDTREVPQPSAIYYLLELQPPINLSE